MFDKLKTINKNQVISIYVCISVFLRTLYITVNETLEYSQAVDLIIKVFLLAAFCILTLLIFIIMDGNERKIFIVAESIVFMLVLITALRYPEIGINVFINYGWLFVSFIPMICFMKDLNDYHMFYEYLVKLSYVVLGLCTLIYFFHVRTLSTNLVFSYTLLLSVLIHIVELKQKKKITILLVVLFELGMLLTYGSRGTLVCLMVFVLLFLLKTMNRKEKIYLLLAGIIMLIGYQIAYRTGMLRQLFQMLLDNGKYIRVLDLLSSGEFFSNNGRFDIYMEYFNYIIEKPLFGWGIGADLCIGWFPHNIIIEIVFNFGVFSVVIFYIMAKLVKNMFFVFWKIDTNSLSLILLISGVFPLFFSTSYLEWMYFWIFLGLLINLYMNKNTLCNNLNEKNIEETEKYESRQ